MTRHGTVIWPNGYREPLSAPDLDTLRAEAEDRKRRGALYCRMTAGPRAPLHLPPSPGPGCHPDRDLFPPRPRQAIDSATILVLIAVVMVVAVAAAAIWAVIGGLR